jgi:hypothetical protein
MVDNYVFIGTTTIFASLEECNKGLYLIRIKDKKDDSDLYMGKILKE